MTCKEQCDLFFCAEMTRKLLIILYMVFLLFLKMILVLFFLLWNFLVWFCYHKQSYCVFLFRNKLSNHITQPILILFFRHSWLWWMMSYPICPTWERKALMCMFLWIVYISMDVKIRIHHGSSVGGNYWSFLARIYIALPTFICNSIFLLVIFWGTKP